jgi:hypothetical protein
MGSPREAGDVVPDAFRFFVQRYVVGVEHPIESAHLVERVAAKRDSKSVTGAPAVLKISTVRRAPEGLVMPFRRTWAM